MINDCKLWQHADTLSHNMLLQLAVQVVTGTMMLSLYGNQLPQVTTTWKILTVLPGPYTTRDNDNRW